MFHEATIGARHSCLMDFPWSAFEPGTLCEGYLGSRSCDEKDLIGFATQTAVGFRKLARMEPLKHGRSSQADSVVRGLPFQLKAPL